MSFFNRKSQLKNEMLFSKNPVFPNDLSIAIGNKIHEAREERGYSREIFAESIYQSLEYLERLEVGEIYPDVITLLHVTNRTGKPFSYFLPETYQLLYFGNELTEAPELSKLALDLLLLFERLQDGESKEVILKQVKALVDYLEPLQAREYIQ